MFETYLIFLFKSREKDRKKIKAVQSPRIFLVVIFSETNLAAQT